MEEKLVSSSRSTSPFSRLKLTPPVIDRRFGIVRPLGN